MEYQFRKETGLQMFERLNARPSLTHLDDTLFPAALAVKEFVEISGDVTCGKTLLLTQFIMQCILPETYRNLMIGGINCSVVFINTDHHFQVFKLVRLCESHIMQRAEQQKINLDLRTVEALVKESLRKLTLLSCYDSPQLFITLYSLQRLLTENTNIGLVLLDSIAANYWQDALGGGVRRMDHYCKNIVKTVQKCLADLRVVVMYTRPSYFQTKSCPSEEVSAEPSYGHVTRRIHLKQAPVASADSNSVFSATVTRSTDVVTHYYSITSNGLKWTTE